MGVLVKTLEPLDAPTLPRINSRGGEAHALVVLPPRI